MKTENLILALGVLGVLPTLAAIAPATLINDNMVLQREKPVPIWGRATAGNEVKVTFSGQTKKTVAAADGAWRVDLDAMAADAVGKRLVLTESKPGASAPVDEKAFTNVVVGEVWLCGGQSNMGFSMWPAPQVEQHAGRELNGYYDLALTRERDVRGVKMPCGWSAVETNHAALAWKPFVPESKLGDFSAAAWHYAVRLHAALGVPVGVIESCWGASSIETWIPASAYAGSKSFQAYATNEIPPRGQKFVPQQTPRACWNAMIHPLAPYAVRGAIWYQGCANRERWREYYEMLDLLRASWGQAFGCGLEMPFFICQITPFDYSWSYGSDLEEKDSGQCEIREEMERWGRDRAPLAGCVNLSDIGELDCIHPGDKRTVGTRLAAMALNRIYGFAELKCDAPTFREAKLSKDGRKVTLTFDHVANWCRKGSYRERFELAGADGKYVPVACRYTANVPTVDLDVPTNMVPKKVAYLRRSCTHSFLKNEAGLPLGPFRGEVKPFDKTDVWYGHRRHSFTFRNHTAWIVEPSVPSAPGKPWTWTMQWAEAFVERTAVPDLLKRGYHHVTIDLFPTRMDEKGLADAAAFQEYLVKELGFAPKANLIGMSWGGFFSTRYAATYPQNVAKIYLDAPLLNFDGFPENAIGLWASRKPADGVWSKDPHMPINLAAPIAKAGIPILLAYGGRDETVPPAKNTETFIPRFKAAGGKIDVHYRPNYGHHPHGFDEQVRSVVIDFIAGAGGLPLEAEFLNPPAGYGEVPFWWWTGDRLDKARLAEQLEDLHAKGVSGTQVNYCHLMTDGWKTAPTDPPVFSEAWWDFFASAAAKSAELGMGIGLSGYTLDWPDRDNLFRQLGISSGETRGRVLELRNGKVVPVAREGTLDPLNPASAQRLIDRFLRPFWEKLPEKSRAALDYFFQDELRLAGNRFVWCDDFPREFQKRKGYDVVPKLPLLFAKEVSDEAAKVRLDYNDVMVALTEERYFRPIYDWHAARGKIYACDPATRGYDPIEFGDYMRAMRWYTAPGFDTPGGRADALKCKMGSSIAHLYRRPRVWLEGYHSQGWQANTASIFAATAQNYAYGANLLNLHGLYYATYGGWWEWAPPCYHFHQPYWQLMGTTLKYFERLSYLLTRGDHVCDVAIVTPQEPCVVDEDRARRTSVALAPKLVERLAVNGCTDCDFIDATSLAAATVTKDELGAVLSVAGERYRAVILPDMFAIRPASRAKLDAFARAGGKVIDAKKPEDVALPVVATPDVAGHAGLKYHHRRTPTHDIYYLVDWNFTDPITLRATGTLEYWDAWTGKKLAAPRRGEPVLAVVKRLGDAESSPRQKKVVIQSSSDAVGTPRPQIDAVGTPRPQNSASPVALAGPWRMTVKPVLDNKWGDYRLPATREKMGPEVRRMHWVEQNRDEELGFGPQFFVSSPPSSHSNIQTFKHSNTSPSPLYSFSWRYGVFDKPGPQNDHHGLNRIISDCFFVMGPYANTWGIPYDMRPSAEEMKRETRYTTFVYAPRELQAKILGEAERPQALFPETANTYSAPTVVSLTIGGESHQIGDTVTLKAGFTPVEITYRGCGRAALVFRDAAVDQRRYKLRILPLAMKWEPSPMHLNYDPFGGRETVGTFTATVPPGTVDADVRVNGELLEKKIADGVLTVRVKFAPGCVGGSAFTDVIRLKTETAEVPLGDWAQWDGMRCYSGGAVYETEFVLKEARKLTLDLGAVGCCAEVRVNGGAAQVRTCPPWTFDVSDDLKVGANTLSVTVYNTLNNHMQSIPTRYKVPVSSAPSGLLGPVVLK